MINEIFIGFIKKNIKLYIIYFITLLYIPINKVAIPHIYGKFIAKLKNNNMNKSFKLLILLIGSWLTIQLIHSASNIIYYNLMPKFNAYVRMNITNKIIDSYKNSYEDLLLGDTITKIIKSPWVVEDIFNIIEDFIFRHIIVIISVFCYLTYHNVGLGLIYIICMMGIIGICFAFTKTCTKYVKMSEQIYDMTHEEIEDTLSNLLSIYTSQKTTYEKGRLNKLNTKVYQAEQKNMFCNNKFRVIYSIAFVLVFAILNIYSFYIFYKKQITIDILVAIIIINYTILTSFMSIYYETRRFIDIRGRIYVISQFIEKMPNKKYVAETEMDLESDFTIKISKLNFSYLPDKPIIKDLSFTIKQNEKIALVGSIGSGKSTVGKLLVRLIEYSSGHIYLNGVDIKHINIDNLRAIINYIPQHPKLFNRTLYENIMYGVDKKISRKEILKMLEEMDLKETVSDFRNMMDKNVGKGGSKISGGQRQIVWLLRLVLKKSKVIILDEPTSSLDKESKKDVIKFIKEFSKDKTIILITHDKELHKIVDRIIELDKGHVSKDNSIN
jgi:ABC-type multidrug transport system fused ATPase/permease subunit